MWYMYKMLKYSTSTFVMLYVCILMEIFENINLLLSFVFFTNVDVEKLVLNYVAVIT